MAAPAALSPLRCWALLGLLAAHGTRPAASKPCPQEKDVQRSRVLHVGGGKIELEVRSHLPMDATLWWVDFEGREYQNGIIGAEGFTKVLTHAGHSFVARALIDHTLLTVFEMPPGGPRVLHLNPCDDLKLGGSTPDTSRWEEFEKLVSEAGSPCVGPSANWSCVRWISDEEVAARDPAKYGFSEVEARMTQPHRKAGEQMDEGYVSQQPYIVNVTDYDGGYLKMRMTDRMKEVLYPWFHKASETSAEMHDPVSGSYLNDAVVKMHKVNLDKFQEVRLGIVQEMGQVLQWWTKQRLRHTSTFGVRVYHRGAILVNHLDRADTHIASAVIQVDQRVDEGWPLEIVHPWYPGRKEVYLQPGEMVLYEGARIRHGRPMRLVGDDFANIFTHFAPLSWHGPKDQPENPLFRTPPKKAALDEPLEL